MNAQFAQQMQSVNAIVNEAFPFFQEAANQRVAADAEAAKQMKNRKIIYIIAVVLSTCIPMVGPLVAIAAGIFLYRDYKGRFAAEVEAHKQEAYARANDVQVQGEAIFEAHETEIASIPGEYCYPMATEYLMKIANAGRVDNINEALLMLDEQLHRWSVEEANAAIVAEQQSQSASLKGIRRSNAINAAANVTNTLFKMATWF